MMFNGFQGFGNVWLDPERIIGVSFKYKEDFIEQGVTGIMQKAQTDKLEEVALFLDTGAIIRMTGAEAESVLEWWNAVRTTYGDIA